jgi:hypothetical protein
MSYPKSEYDLIDIQISSMKNKKYDAFIVNKHTGQLIKIGFGSRIPLMQHYRDSTPLKYYSFLDHNDEDRKRKYVQRFKNKFDPNEYSATYFSTVYLWT